MAIQYFAAIAGEYDPAIATGVNQMIANGIAGNAQTITEAITLYIIIIAAMAWTREMTPQDVTRHLIRASFIAFFMTAEGFGTYIAVPAMTTIPDWIAQTINGGTGVAAGPQQFDLLWSAVQHQTSAIYQQATGIENLAYRVEAAFVNGQIGALLLIAFAIWELSRGVMGLLVATLPFVLFMLLFKATASVPQRVMDKMVGLLILQIMLAISLQIMIAADAHIMIRQGAETATGIDDQIAGLWGIALVFLFGVGLVVLIPSIAAYVGGGIAMNIAMATASGMRAGVDAVRRGAGAAGNAGRRAVNRARG